MLLAQGGNDFVAAQFSPESCQLATSPAASAAAPHKTAVQDSWMAWSSGKFSEALIDLEIGEPTPTGWQRWQETSDPVGFNYYTAQHGDCVQYQVDAVPCCLLSLLFFLAFKWFCIFCQGAACPKPSGLFGGCSTNSEIGNIIFRLEDLQIAWNWQEVLGRQMQLEAWLFHQLFFFF